jgi:hypothetical protein
MSFNKVEKKLQKIFDVLSLCCSEVSLIENILKFLKGIKEVLVIVARWGNEKGGVVVAVVVGVVEMEKMVFFN